MKRKASMSVVFVMLLTTLLPLRANADTDYDEEFFTLYGSISGWKPLTDTEENVIFTGFYYDITSISTPVGVGWQGKVWGLEGGSRIRCGISNTMHTSTITSEATLSYTIKEIEIDQVYNVSNEPTDNKRPLLEVSVEVWNPGDEVNKIKYYPVNDDWADNAIRFEIDEDTYGKMMRFNFTVKACEYDGTVAIKWIKFTPEIRSEVPVFSGDIEDVIYLTSEKGDLHLLMIEYDELGQPVRELIGPDAVQSVSMRAGAPMRVTDNNNTTWENRVAAQDEPYAVVIPQNVDQQHSVIVRAKSVNEGVHSQEVRIGLDATGTPTGIDNIVYNKGNNTELPLRYTLQGVLIGDIESLPVGSPYIENGKVKVK